MTQRTFGWARTTTLLVLLAASFYGCDSGDKGGGGSDAGTGSDGGTHSIPIGGTGCNVDGDCITGKCDKSSVGETGRCCGSGECCDGSPSDMSDCGAGSYCRASAFQCVTGMSGAPCDASEDCDSGNYCAVGNLCMPTLALGGTTCTSNPECASGYCDLSTTGPETGRCCSGGECCDADSSCAAGSQCVDVVDAASLYHCESGNAGAACDDDTDCNTGNFCRESTDVCVDGASGSSCDDNLDCDSAFYCGASNTCVSRIANGQTTCDEYSDCSSNHCDLNGAKSGMCCSDADVGATGECCTVDGDCGAGNSCRTSAFQCVSGIPGSKCDAAGNCDLYMGNAGSALCGSTGPTTGVCCFSGASVPGSTGRCCTQDSDCVSGDKCITSLFTCVSGGGGSLCIDNGDCDSNSCNTASHLCN